MAGRVVRIKVTGMLATRCHATLLYCNETLDRRVLWRNRRCLCVHDVLPKF